jgi:hypothetical protein
MVKIFLSLISYPVSVIRVLILLIVQVVQGEIGPSCRIVGSYHEIIHNLTFRTAEALSVS